MAPTTTTTTIHANNTVDETVNQNQTTLENYTHNYNITNNDHHYNKGAIVYGDNNVLKAYVNAQGGR